MRWGKVSEMTCKREEVREKWKPGVFQLECPGLLHGQGIAYGRKGTLKARRRMDDGNLLVLVLLSFLPPRQLCDTTVGSSAEDRMLLKETDKGILEKPFVFFKYQATMKIHWDCRKETI